MEIAVVGDVHLGCSDYTDKRISDFSNKFIEAIDVALKHDAKAILLLGDIFDSSAYRRSVDSFASSLHDIAPTLVRLRSERIPIVCILGNHEFGRGREGGEIRILADLGFVHVLNDGVIDIDGVKFCGISWKSDTRQFSTALMKLESHSKNSFLLIHQFVIGSKSIPEQLGEVSKDGLKNWKKVFVGHHHARESFANICIPGSLEIHNALEIARGLEKGLVLFDTETGEEEFLPLRPSRPIKYSEIRVQGMSALGVEKSLKAWILANAEPQALLIARLTGKMKSGRSSEINLRDCRILGIQKGCLDIYIQNSVDDPVRTASDIRSTMKVDDFFKSWFKRDSEKAALYFDKFRELGDDFATEIRDKIVEGLS